MKGRLGFCSTVLVLCLCVLAASGWVIRRADAGTQGSVSGVLFHDLDENGVQDVGEPGLLGHSVELSIEGAPFDATETGADGVYSLTAPEGDYTLRADTDFHAFLCVDSFGSFNPLSLDECMTPEVPWAFTTAQELAVTASSEQEVVADFGVREMDIMLLAGRAFYQKGGSPPGTILEAFFGGTKCGETELMSMQGHNYELPVMGAGEIDGCPQPGEEVTFTINGIEAVHQICWEVCQSHPTFYEPTGSGFKMRGLVAIEDYAVYWTEELAYPGASNPVVQGVYFSIDGGCDNKPGAGVELVDGFSSENWVGFSNLAVPSETVSPGCGYPGAEVHLRGGFNGPELGTVAIWEPGIRKIDIDFPEAVGSGDVNCDKDVDALDGLAFLRRLAGLASDTDCWLIADVNCDGAKDALDVVIILQYVAALPFGLPAGCPPVNQAGP